ncbi:hypothetical protein [Nocardia testacea]
MIDDNRHIRLSTADIRLPGDEAVQTVGRAEIVGAVTVVGVYRALTLPE